MKDVSLQTCLQVAGFVSFPHIAIVCQNISWERYHVPMCWRTSSGYEVHCRGLLVSDVDLNVDDGIKVEAP